MVRNSETQATMLCLFITPRPDDRTSPSLFPQHPLPDKTNSFLNQTGRMPAPPPPQPRHQPRGLRFSRASRAVESSSSTGSWDWWHPGVTSEGMGREQVEQAQNRGVPEFPLEPQALD